MALNSLLREIFFAFSLVHFMPSFHTALTSSGTFMLASYHRLKPLATLPIALPTFPTPFQN